MVSTYVNICPPVQHYMLIKLIKKWSPDGIHLSMKNKKNPWLIKFTCNSRDKREVQRTCDFPDLLMARCSELIYQGDHWKCPHEDQELNLG
jgi:hypothetical protein